MDSLQVDIKIPTINLELVTLFLSEQKLFQGCVEIEESTPLHKVPKEFETLEFGTKAAEDYSNWLKNQPDKVNTILQCFFENKKELNVKEIVSYLQKKFSVEFLTSEIINPKQCLQEYKKNAKGICIGKNLWVGPSWDIPPEDKIAIFIDSSTAFGTGDHPTTSMCLEWIEKKQLSNFNTILDLGSGSGVLTIACRYFCPNSALTAIDLDPLCEQASFDNIEANRNILNIQKNINWAFGENALINSVIEKNSVDLVISNIYAEVLIKLIPYVKNILKPNGTWVCSGITAGDLEQSFTQEVENKFKLSLRTSKSSPNLNSLTNTDDNWVLLELENIE